MRETTLPQSLDSRPKTNGWRIVVIGTVALWTVNAVWLAIDTRPPVWDMALHQAYALHYVPGFPKPADLRFWQLSGNYPPLVHIFIATAFSLLHPSSDVAAFVNLPATILLLWALVELSTGFTSPVTARWTVALTLLTPYFIWMSRETILDYWLTAFVITAWMLLRKSNGFSANWPSRFFAVVCGLGLLTKWLFAGFMAVPVLWIAARHRLWKDASRVRNAAQALFLTALIAGPWYLPNLSRLFQYFGENAHIGALEGEPPVFSFQSLIYYLRLLEGYQLYALLFIITLAGIAITLWRRLLRDPALWIAMIGGGWLAVTLLRTKDPRFTMPLLPLILLAPAAMLARAVEFRAGRIAQVLIVAVLMLQAYVTNFGVSWLPQQMIVMTGYQGSLRWDWQLYSQHYFGILGAPRRENWRQNEIIARVTSEAQARSARANLMLVPDLPRFNTSNFLLASMFERMPVGLGHPSSLADFEGFDFVVVTDQEQGMPWTTQQAMSLTKSVQSNPAVFRPIATYNLPDNDVARLFFIDRAAAQK